MSDVHGANKAALSRLRVAMYDFDARNVRAVLEALIAPDARIRMCHPFGDMTGPAEFFERCYAPLIAAMPDLERRDYILAAGPDDHGANWVGCGGYYTGVSLAPWLGIPPTGHQDVLRYHEFFRFEDGRVTEIQAIWDIPALMIQGGVWPMSPSLGLEWHVPGPATEDGIISGPRDADRSDAARAHVRDMLVAMSRHPTQGGPEVMEMERFWHPKMNWYGPGGIGTARGIEGFRNWHQIPFLSAMPDRGQRRSELVAHFFADGDYVAVTGWPNMRQTVSGDGWLGIAPSDRKIDLRSLDFWRIENGLIRENWVLVDLLHAYDQLGVDVFARLREFNKARVPGAISYG